MKNKITSILIVCIFIVSIGSVYAADGDVLWAKTHAGPFGVDIAYGVATDSQNNVIVTGAVTNSSGNADYYTIKYDPSGNVIWSKTYAGLLGIDEARGVATDSQNNVIVTGFSVTGISSDYYTIKYDASGNVVWSKTHGGPAGADYGYGVATDSQNNVIVTGSVNYGGSNPWSDYYTIKYDPSGNVIWSKRYTGPAGIDEAYGVATDSQNNVIVTGKVLNLSGNDDYYTIKYDPSGNVIWSKTHAGPFGDDEAWGVTTDTQNNVIVTGSVTNSSGNYDYYTIKYDASGNEVWSKTYDSTYGDDRPFSVTADSYNNVIVTGKVRNSSGNDDYYTIKYDPSGNVIWSKTHAGTFGADVALGVATDSQNNVIVTGAVTNSSGNYDYYTIKYQGVPPVKPVKKSLPIHQIMKILGLSPKE